jgi:hypothetical protein
MAPGRVRAGDAKLVRSGQVRSGKVRISFNYKDCNNVYAFTREPLKFCEIICSTSDEIFKKLHASQLSVK